ncbi:TPA: sulfatase [Candidatus Latescibacteria bacterium]|nr:sulfatase [Candidatus Latescibacterota bacterium]
MKPNVIFILCDDLGYTDLGCYGGTTIPTPNLDTLAAGGMRFTQCYTGSSICAPSRCVLNTGLHSGHCRVRDNFGIVGGVGDQKRVPLEPDDFTVAELFKSVGYTTGMTGKWGLGEPDTTGVPNRKGFDEWFGYLNQRRAHTYYPDFIWRNEEKIELPENEDEKKERYIHDEFVDFALDFIRDNKGGPFYLHIPWTLPHGKYEIPSVGEFADREWTDDEKVYAAMVTKIDSQVGQIVDLLAELGISEQTLIFFGSDHGSARRWEVVFDSCGPLRGCKGDMYEGGLRTPMIVSWPGTISGNVVSEQVWYYADFMPTVAEILGEELPIKPDGVSILPTLLGEDQTEDTANRFLYWERHAGGGFKQAVRWRHWKAVRPPTDRLLDEPLELYDLDTDLGETTDVADQHTEVIAEIQTYLEEARTPSKNYPIGVKSTHG